MQNCSGLGIVKLGSIEKMSMPALKTQLCMVFGGRNFCKKGIPCLSPVFRLFRFLKQVDSKFKVGSGSE